MSHYTALVVEDSTTMRQLLVSALSRLTEVRVIEAEDGVHGLKELQANQVDILLTDINMPRMDGLKLVGLVRKDRERGLALGADRYFVKPVKASEVVDTVSELLKL